MQPNDVWVESETRVLAIGLEQPREASVWPWVVAWLSAVATYGVLVVVWNGF